MLSCIKRYNDKISKKLFNKKYKHLTIAEYLEYEFMLETGEKEEFIIDGQIYSGLLIDEHHGVFITT